MNYWNFNLWLSNLRQGVLHWEAVNHPQIRNVSHLCDVCSLLPVKHQDKG